MKKLRDMLEVCKNKKDLYHINSLRTIWAYNFEDDTLITHM